MAKENTEEHIPNWPRIPDHPCRILIIRYSWSAKTNALLYLTMIIMALLIKSIYLLRTKMKQNVNFLSTNVKAVVVNDWKI